MTSIDDGSTAHDVTAPQPITVGESTNGDGPRDFFPVDWKLTRSEAAILRLLLNTEVAKKTDLLETLYGDSLAESTLNTLRVFIHSIRRKTGAAGMTIRTISGVGYALVDKDSWRESLDSKTTRQ